METITHESKVKDTNYLTQSHGTPDIRQNCEFMPLIYIILLQTQWCLSFCKI